jgi:Domain of unknown function (DUF4190)/Protein of unknown function (DUF2510)
MIAPPTDQHPPASSTPAWHPHPDYPTIERYWDGEHWTGDHRFVTDALHQPAQQYVPATAQPAIDESSAAAIGHGDASNDASLPAAQPYGELTHASQPTSGKAIAALILGITSLVFGVVLGPFAVLLSIPAVVLGVKARREIACDPNIQGSGLALAGLILGIIGIALFVLAMIFIVVFLFGAGDTSINLLS